MSEDNNSHTVGETRTTTSSLHVPPGDPEGALAKILEFYPSATGRRYRLTPHVVGALRRAGYSHDQIDAITWDWLCRAGSKDVREQPTKTRRWLGDVIDHFNRTYDPDKHEPPRLPGDADVITDVDFR